MDQPRRPRDCGLLRPACSMAAANARKPRIKSSSSDATWSRKGRMASEGAVFLEEDAFESDSKAEINFAAYGLAMAGPALGSRRPAISQSLAMDTKLVV